VLGGQCNYLTRVIAAVSIVGTLCSATTVAAQSVYSMSEYYASIGGVEANSTSFEALGWAEYDTNVARSSAALAAERGITPQDEIYTAAAQLKFTRILGGSFFFIRGTGGYEFYQTNSILNGEHIDLEAGAKRKFGICDVAAFGTYLRMVSNLNTLAAPISANTETDRSGLVGTRCGKGSLSASVSVSPHWSDNSDPSMQTSNYRSLLADASIGYSSSHLGEISVFGDFDSTIFPNRFVSTGSSNESDAFRTYSGGIRFDRKFGSHLKLIASVSALALTPRSVNAPGFSGLAYDAEVAYTPNSRLEADISASRRVEPTDRLNVTYSVDDIYRASLGYELCRQIRFALDGRIAHESFFGAQINPHVDLTEQSIHSVSATLTYTFRPKLSVILGVTRENGEADLSAYRYDDTRLMLSLSAAS
jgi:hypothetical protein